MVFWYGLISPSTGVWYWRKGNWVIAGLYTALVLFFVTMYGGFRLGDLEKGNVIYSQILSIIFVNFITYIQMALLAYRFPKVWILAFLPCATSYALSYGRMDIPWFMSIYFQERFLFVYGNEKNVGTAEQAGKERRSILI